MARCFVVVVYMAAVRRTGERAGEEAGEDVHHGHREDKEPVEEHRGPVRELVSLGAEERHLGSTAGPSHNHSGGKAISTTPSPVFCSNRLHLLISSNPSARRWN